MEEAGGGVEEGGVEAGAAAVGATAGVGGGDSFCFFFSFRLIFNLLLFQDNKHERAHDRNRSAS